MAPSSFVIQNDQFVKDGEVFTLRSGELHYFRVPSFYWRDRMQRMKALGLNSITMYVAWNYHEEVEGQITRLDQVSAFLDDARAERMLVYFRPGPYICSEWEMGGLPSWLLWKDKAGIKLRTYEPTYISAVDKWLSALYNTVANYTYSKGGPIALVQIENEYGSYGNCSANINDARYMNYLLNLATKHFGTDIVYTTVDGGEGENAAPLESGSPWKGDARVLATVDGFPANKTVYETAFHRQKNFNALGNSPKMWSELWVGWFTSWNNSVPASLYYSVVHQGVTAMIEEAASFSLYMAHGGTNFGFWSGANGDQQSSYMPDITSYDYSAPISEAGDHNKDSDGRDLFQAVQLAIASRHGKPSTSEPKPVDKIAYGIIKLDESAGLLENLGVLATCEEHVSPNAKRLPSFEDLQHSYGFVLYSHDGDIQSGSVNITPDTAHDRVQIFVGMQEVGIAYRPECPTMIKWPAGPNMSLLVENLGRINYGEGIVDHKGYLGTPPVIGDWVAQCLPLKPVQVQRLPFVTDSGNTTSGPIFRRGGLRIRRVVASDTFFDMRGFTKGYVWVNGFNLGRFWETRGPQHTLYVPAPFLKTGWNEIIVLDLHHSNEYALESVADPRYDKPAVQHRDYTWIFIFVGIFIVFVLCLASFRLCWRRKRRIRSYGSSAETESGTEFATDEN